MKIKDIYIDKLQFYWRLKSSEDSKNIVEDFLPFESDYDKKLMLIIQKRKKEVLDSLEKIYQEEPNIGHIQEVSNYSSFYGTDFLNFIKDSISKYGHEFKKILEVGCGGCLLLAILKKSGYEVLGIDPSPFAQREGEKRGLNVVVDFFPTKHIKGKFDLIYSSNVLEHLADPVDFLKAHHDYLNQSGLLILAVPDCTESILNGDISMFYHQHLGYYDVESLENALFLSGFEPLKIIKAKYGGNLYCVAKRFKKTQNVKIPSKDRNAVKYHNFLKNFRRIISKIIKYLDEVRNSRKNTFGFYAPLRALPYIAFFNLKEEYRFFDDTSYWHFKYFDGINVFIEDFEDLKKNPVTDLLIMSPTFGNVIQKKVLDYFSNSIRVKKLTDFFV